MDARHLPGENCQPEGVLRGYREFLMWSRLSQTKRVYRLLNRGCAASNVGKKDMLSTFRSLPFSLPSSSSSSTLTSWNDFYRSEWPQSLRDWSGAPHVWRRERLAKKMRTCHLTLHWRREGARAPLTILVRVGCCRSGNSFFFLTPEVRKFGIVSEHRNFI